MIGDGLGVGRAHADVHQRHAQAVFARQVVGGHLGEALDAVGVVRRRHAEVVLRVAGLDKADVPFVVAVFHELAAEGGKLIDVALVVGEQHEALEVLRVRGGVVVQALQGQVDTLGCEHRQRLRFITNRAVCAVGDGIVDLRKVGQRKCAAQRARLFGRNVHGGSLHHERQRNRPVAYAHHDGAVVIVQEAFDLHAVVVTEEVRARERRAVHARIRHCAPCRPRVAHQRFWVDGDAEIRIAGGQVFAAVLAARKGVEAIADRLRGALVDGGDALDGSVGVGADRQVVRGIEMGSGAGIGHVLDDTDVL